MNLICQNKRSNKFWNIEIKKKSFTTNYGRIGTMGQYSIKTFWSEDICLRAANKIIKSKRKKGYVDAITEELITKAFIMILSGIAEYKSPGEIYYRDDKFNRLATLQFIDGADNIIFRHYFENGSLKSEHRWVNNKQHGDHFGWYENGNLHWEKIFNNGKLISDKKY